MVDAPAVRRIEGLGGLRAVAIAHPRVHGGIAARSRAFCDAPVRPHAADAGWARRSLRRDPSLGQRR